MREKLRLAADGAVLIEVAQDEPAARDRLAQRVLALGLRVAHAGESEVVMVLRSRRATQIAALLGAHADRVCLSEDELDRVLVVADREGEPAVDRAPFHEIAQQIEALSRRASREAQTLEARALLLDPRVCEHVHRNALVSIIEAASNGAAIEALGAAIALRRASATSEAVAFGRLVSRGVRRFECDGPFAIELDDARDECAPPLLAWFRAAERYQRLCDERGVTVHRALYREIPWLDAVSDALPASLSLLRALDESASARVWIAGVSLPAALPWALWTTVLGQRARR